MGEGINGLPVPAGTAPTLDGILSEAEWDDALELALSDDTSLFAKHAEGFLYLGVRAVPRAEVVGNIYVAREGTVEILHASHALGSSTYRLEDGTWLLERPFVWSCRTLGFSDAAVGERKAFLDANGWLTSVVNLGVPEQMEYRIAIESASMRMLFRFDIHREGQEVLTWPLGTNVGLDLGPLPQEAVLQPDRWCDVVLEAPSLATLSVPRGAAPTLDGSLSVGEWDDAQEVSLDSRTSLFLKHSDGTLFLGLSAPTMDVISPCIVRGGGVWVLHASAVLGAAIYEESTGTWTQTQGFTWSCRSTGFEEGPFGSVKPSSNGKAGWERSGIAGSRRASSTGSICSARTHLRSCSSSSTRAIRGGSFPGRWIR
jgi:hypothetical protein